MRAKAGILPENELINERKEANKISENINWNKATFSFYLLCDNLKVVPLPIIYL